MGSVTLLEPPPPLRASNTGFVAESEEEFGHASRIMPCASRASPSIQGTLGTVLRGVAFGPATIVHASSSAPAAGCERRCSRSRTSNVRLSVLPLDRHSKHLGRRPRRRWSARVRRRPKPGRWTQSRCLSDGRGCPAARRQRCRKGRQRPPCRAHSLPRNREYRRAARRRRKQCRSKDRGCKGQPVRSPRRSMTNPPRPGSCRGTRSGRCRSRTAGCCRRQRPAVSAEPSANQRRMCFLRPTPTQVVSYPI